MKKVIFLLLLAPFVALAQSNTFKVEGKLDGYPDGTTIRLVKNGENTDIAKATLSKGKFILKGGMPEPALCFLFVGDEPSPVEIYIENSVISFKGDKSQPGKYKISGSESHDDFSSFLEKFLPLAKQLSALASSINYTMPGTERDGLMNTYTSLQASLQKEIDNMVQAKPKSPVTLFLLDATYTFNEDPILLENRFNQLAEAIRKSTAGKRMEAVIAEKKIGAVGTPAIDFSQPDTTGALVSLSSFRGKYVLVDFWASWCGPCRQENPNVVENYNKFNKKNFTVLGVSLDRQGQKNKWMEAIQKDKLTWTHVSDLQFWDNAAAKLYHIVSIPQNMLVDPQGKIVARNLRGPALEEKLCELLGCD